MGEFFSRNWEKLFAWISKNNIGGRKLWGNFFLEIGRNCLRGLPKSNIGGRKLWGNFSRNWEKLFAWISKKQYWREETMGEFF